MIAALDANNKTFIMYITIWEQKKMPVYLKKKPRLKLKVKTKTKPNLRSYYLKSFY